LNTHRTNKALMLALYPVLKDAHTGLSALGLGASRRSSTKPISRRCIDFPRRPSL